MNRGLLIGAAVAALLVGMERSVGVDKNPSRQTKPGEWFLVRLTEYHPDAPPSARKMEGGPKDRFSLPVRTIEDFREHRAAYVAVAADLELQGRSVPYGARLYLEGWPDVVFRLVDTGKHFRGDGKEIRKAGHEPLDIATQWNGKHMEFNGKLSRARIDFADTLPKREERVS